MDGIEFIKDEKGNPVKVIIDLKLHGPVFDQFFDQLIRNQRKQPVPPVNQPVEAPANKPVLRRDELIQEIIRSARNFLGTKHVDGGISREGIDCSGLSSMAFKSVEVKLPRSSSDQAKFGTPVDRNSLRPGDLVFFATNDKTPTRVTHVGIITQGSDQGEVRMIHASTSRGVVEEKLFSDYYTKRYLGATRVL